jgi:hypothetical protein
MFLFRSSLSITELTMNAATERKLIRLWNRLRLLEREGRPAAAVRRQIEQALPRESVMPRAGVGPVDK